jgi:hypothetical protein
MNKIVIVIFSLFIWSCSPKLQPLNLNLSSLPKHFSKEQEDSLSLPILKDFIHDTLLLALLDTAINLNHDIQSSFQRIEMAKAGIREAKSAMLPTGGLTTVNSLRKFGLYTMDGAGNITAHELNVSTEKIFGEPIYISRYESTNIMESHNVDEETGEMSIKPGWSEKTVNGQTLTHKGDVIYSTYVFTEDGVDMKVQHDQDLRRKPQESVKGLESKVETEVKAPF